MQKINEKNIMKSLRQLTAPLLLCCSLLTSEAFSDEALNISGAAEVRPQIETEIVAAESNASATAEAEYLRAVERSLADTIFRRQLKTRLLKRARPTSESSLSNNALAGALNFYHSRSKKNHPSRNSSSIGAGKTFNPSVSVETESANGSVSIQYDAKNSVAAFNYVDTLVSPRIAGESFVGASSLPDPLPNLGLGDSEASSSFSNQSEDRRGADLISF